MRYQCLPLFLNGVEIPRHEWKYQYTYDGTFRIIDTLENGFNRVLKIAEFTTSNMKHVYQLFDPQIVWWNDDRFTLKGFERQAKDGVTTSYAQSWLITLREDDRQDQRPEYNGRRSN